MLIEKSYIITHLLKPPLAITRLEQIRTSFFNRYRKGPHKENNPEFDTKRWFLDLFTKEGMQELKRDIKMYASKPFTIEFTKRVEPDTTDIFEHFDSRESIKRWKALSDRDSLHGYSTAKFTLSPSGHGLFHGVVDNTLPDDGMTANSGFVCLAGPKPRREWLFKLENNWVWDEYNTFEIRYRGDGRRYFIVINTADPLNDLSYYDNYAYPIYTRGGPYWQTARIPFSKFIFNYKSFTQDIQDSLPIYSIKFVSVVLHDKVDGPFSLEIDYMGLRFESRAHKEVSPYENYKFGHMRWRPLQVECEAPERD